jgi:surface polysaccharide O-acyltransferase-like enzyme
MKRSVSVDLIKSLSIFGVVFIHGSTLLDTPSSFQSYIGALFRFCVPCFIIIWAYFLEKSYQKNRALSEKRYILNKFIHLFIIFSVWSLLYFFILVDWNTINLTTMITTHFSGYGWAGQYFFIILFQLLLLFPLIRILYNHKATKHLTIFILALLYLYWGYNSNNIPEIFQKLGYRPFIFWLPYVLIGISLAKNNIKKISLPVSFVIILIPLEFYILNHFDVEHSEYIIFSVLMSSIIFCVAIFQKDIKIKSKRMLHMINFIGENTMTIFVANPVVILILTPIIPKDIFSDLIIWKILSPFFSTCIILAICLVISVIINKTRLKGIIN